MSTTIANPVPLNPPAAKPRRRKPGRAVVISNVPWEMYEEVLKAFEEKRNLRLTYDRGVLEIMSPSLKHDFAGRILADLIPILAEECAMPMRPGGSTTMKSKKQLKGIEADDIFWIANAAKLAGVDDLDLRIHPPPDLAIEVDVSHSSMNRLKIYAKLGVPEVWRVKHGALIFHVLVGKKYIAVQQSCTFPLITPNDLMPFLEQARSASNVLPIYRAFREWLKQKIAAVAAGSQTPPPAA